VNAVDSPPPLDERYYLRNFELLCATVHRQYEDLLAESERAFLADFPEMSETARCLYVRLVSRVGPLFRPEKLNYPELGELDAALGELIDQGFLCPQPTPELTEIFRLCRKDEILEIFDAQLENAARCRKAELFEQLQERELSVADCAAHWSRWYAEELVQPLRGDVVELLLLLFFGNRHQGLTDFVLNDLGFARYHDYPLDRGFRLFEQRTQIEEYLLVSELGRQYAEALEADEPDTIRGLAKRLLEEECSPALRPRWDRLRNRVARQLERYLDRDCALELYRGSELHPARERQVRILHNEGRLQQALELCRGMLRQAWCEEELDFVQRQIPLLQKKLGLEYQRPPGLDYPESRLQLQRSERGVELDAAEYYQQIWPQVHFVENSLVNTLFGLALWEEIFLPVPGAFVNPFQSAPLDMHTRDFYSSRRKAIDARLERLARPGMATELLASYDRYLGVSNHWVNWRYVDRDLVSTALDTIPATHLLGLWRRILFDPQANRSGFPDLLALDPGRAYCMIEVKGPGDQLQHNQKRWLRFFGQEEIPCLVAWVEWRDA
jgi:hypothetical protein